MTSFFYLLSALIPINDETIARMHAIAHIMKIICEACKIKSAYCEDKSRLPIIHENINVKRPKLIDWPIALVASCPADA